MSLAQVSDDFSDGDFTANPVWSGETTDFEVVGEELKLNAAAAGESYLVTPSTDIHNTTWEIWVDLDFNTSNQNRAYIYLTADQVNLEGDIEGYYVMVGNTSDEVSLYRQDDETSSTEIIDGVDATVAITPTVRIRVTRDAVGNWELFRDLTGGTTFISEGTAFDDTYTTSTYFGVLCDYSVGNIEGFLFDDVSVTAAEAAFATGSITMESANSLRVTFNQDVDVTTAETTSNYTLSDGFGNPTSATVDATNTDQVVLVFSESFANNTYTLTLDDIDNLDQDETISNTDIAVDVSVATDFRNITINEIYPDPNPSIGLPEAEFIELLNNHSLAIKIENFEINGQAIDAFTLEAGAYVILTDDADVADFTSYGDVVAVTSFPNLTNSGLQLILTDNLGNVVDSLSYTTDWYQDTDKDDGGYTLEQINPEIVCNYDGNWIASNNTIGGTPGTVNSVFDNTPDIAGPNLSILTIVDANTILVTFDEPMDETALLGGTYEINPSITVNSTDAEYQSVTLGLDTDLVSGTEYNLTASGLTDCAGNAIENNTLSVIYDTEPPAIASIAVLSELLIKVVFDEAIDEGTAEDESNYSMDNSIGVPEDALWDEETSNEILLSFNNPFQEGSDYTLSINSLEDTLGNALVETLTFGFTYEVAIDSLFVISSSHLQLLFSEAVEPNSATEIENYSVDREIGSPITAFLESNHDRLINLVFQQEFDDNRDLILTIEGIKDTDDNPIITPQQLFVFDTSAPKIDTVFTVSDREVSLVFSEKVEKQSAEKLNHYEYEDIYPIHVSLDTDGQTVIVEFAEAFEPEVVYELLIDEVQDLYGNAIGTRIREDFVYDVLPPVLDSLFVKSPNEIVLVFNEALDTTTAQNVVNYTYTEADINPAMALLNLEEGKKVTLLFEDELIKDQSQILSVNDLKDQRNNEIAESIEELVDNLSFYLSEVTPINKNQLQLTLNKLPGISTANVLTNYSIQNQSITEITVDERIVLLTVNQPFEDDTSYALQVNNIVDQDNATISKTEYEFFFDSKLIRAQFLNKKTITLSFEVAIDTSSPVATDFVLSGNTSPITATVNTGEPEVIKLVFVDNIAENESHTLAWNTLTNIYGNLLPGYCDTIAIDTESPEILDIEIISSNELLISFSELLNESDANFTTYYQVDQGVGLPNDIEYNEQDSTVYLLFEEVFRSNTEYQITITSINDLSNNELDTTYLNFIYEAPYQPAYGELIITEIMANPNDDRAEFFELYNRSAQTIELTGLTFKDGNDETTFTEGVLEPKSYLVVSADNDLFGDISVGKLRSWLTLNNGGESLSIYADESLVFSTTYSDDWYQTDDTKGYSLEMVDVENYCGESRNWSQSNNLEGSPGTVNSIAIANPDISGPSIETSFAEDNNTIQVLFSEKIIPIDDIASQISLDPSLVIDYALLNSPENTSLEIGLFEALSSNQNYLLSIDGVQDCASNAITDNESLVQLPEVGDSLDIVINEILFNPRTGGVDFVEIYNNSEKVIDLQNWQVTSVKSDGSETFKTIATGHLILQPQNYMVLTGDTEILNADYPISAPETFVQISSFPSYNDDEGTVQISNETGQIVDSFTYSEDYHFSLIDDVEGVTLERVRFLAPTNDPNTWQSAASTASYATPGFQNSQFISQGQTSGTVNIDPKVFFPNSSGNEDFTTINYQLDKSGSFANISVFSTEGRLIKELAKNQLLSTTGFVIWDGTDQAGGLAKVGYYIIAFEIFDASGNKSTFKDTVVLGARF